MPDLPVSFTAVVAGDGSLVPPPEVRAALVPGQSVNVRVDAPKDDSPAPTRDEIQAALDRLRSGVTYTGPPIPIEKLGIGGIDYADLYPDGP